MLSGQRKIVVANWKAALSPEKAKLWLDAFRQQYRPVVGIEVVLAVPSLYLCQVYREVGALDGVAVAAQHVSPYPPGAYTGALPAVWLAGMAGYTLSGHREARKYFHETLQEVAGQVREAVSAGLVPILCMERALASAQIAAIDSGDLERVVLSYTPSDAVQLEVAHTVEEVRDAAAFFSALSGGRPVLYGGGVNRANIEGLMGEHELAGVMVGRSCLEVAEFLDLLEALR
ncbi:triose-phosphate isomerase [Desulfolithobacter sp.]